MILDILENSYTSSGELTELLDYQSTSWIPMTLIINAVTLFTNAAADGVQPILTSVD